MSRAVGTFRFCVVDRDGNIVDRFCTYDTTWFLARETARKTVLEERGDGFDVFPDREASR